ncbi:hypothetical protein [Pseudomonas sp.]|uniref:hypothetical protein n=1 Tax=Pseudomonas sp. TaxID=306 RepID=UPI003D0F64A5
MTRKSAQQRAATKGSGSRSFTVIGWVMVLCTVAMAYDWVSDLVRGVHLVYSRVGPSKVYTLAGEPGAYWLSMAVSAVALFAIAGCAAVAFWAASLFKE